MRILPCLLLALACAAIAQQKSGGAPQRLATLSTPASAAVLTASPGQLTPPQIQRMQTSLADWPQLGRYRADDAKLGAPASGEQRVVFLGDSITDGWGRGRGQFFPGKPYVNRGISGQTTPQMLVRFQQDVLALHPVVVVILGGINDIAGNTGPETLDAIENNFRSMVALARAAHVRVVLCSVLPASSLPWRPGVDPRAEIQVLNQWLAGYAAQQNAGFLNYYPALVNGDGGMREELAIDKAVHPNDRGYAIMEPLAEAAIRKALAAPRP